LYSKYWNDEIKVDEIVRRNCKNDFLKETDFLKTKARMEDKEIC
jgi:hypothetical protein